MEEVAGQSVTKEAWAYLQSAGDDEVSYRENSKAFQRVFLRPRVLRNVKDVSLKMTQMCPTLASCAMGEMAEAKLAQNQIQWWQLYVNPDRKITEKVVARAEKLGFKALIVTVDAPQLGRRERDMRHKAPLFSSVQEEEGGGTKGDASQGTGRALSAWLDPSFDWEGLKWLQSITKLPIVLKGVQTGEDAVLAYEANVAGIIVSNHGGRQLDYCRSGLECLEEVMTSLRKHVKAKEQNPSSSRASPGSSNKFPLTNSKNKLVNGEFDVLVDGGVRRGGDVFKALALGAKMVGLGRPFIYGLAAYGEAGVKKVIELLEEELTMVMRLMGCREISDIRREMLVTRELKFHGVCLPNQLDENWKPIGGPMTAKL
eukprot:g3321.t1